MNLFIVEIALVELEAALPFISNPNAEVVFEELSEN